MHCNPIAPRRRSAARRGAASLLALAGCAALLAGCYTTTRRHRRQPSRTTTASATRSRSRKATRTVELFVGSSRGGLTPTQRADVLAFAQAWKREATGGVVIDVPAGTPNERAAADALREIRSILAAAGVPPQRVGVRPYQPADPAKLATVRLNYPP